MRYHYPQPATSKNSWLFEIALVLVRFDHIAGCIVNGEQSGLLTRIATTEAVSSCAPTKYSAFVELERQVLTVTFYLYSIHANDGN